MSFKRYGARQIGEWIDNNVRQAKHLYTVAANDPEFEPASVPPMSAICIRYQGAELSEAESQNLHAEVAQRVEQSGRFWISTTELKGKSWFRINPVNFRTRRSTWRSCLPCFNKSVELVGKGSATGERQISA